MMSKKKNQTRATADFHCAFDAALNQTHSHPLHRALWLEKLDQQLRLQLPSSLANHCQLANIREDQLIFLVDSPLWHSKLRVMQEQLLHLARAQGLAVSRLIIKTRSHQHRPPAIQNALPNRHLRTNCPKGLLQALTDLDDTKQS